VYALNPAFKISVKWRQSMQTKWIEPSKLNTALSGAVPIRRNGGDIFSRA
jgi:hypothetical protein